MSKLQGALLATPGSCKQLDIKTKGELLIHFADCHEQIHRKPAKNLNKRKQRKFEQKLAKLAKLRHLASKQLFFKTRSLSSLDSPRDFKMPISN
jgi:hypothetical protein